MKTNLFRPIVVILLLCAFFLSSCDKEKKIVIASKPHVEQYVLANILQLLIEKNTDNKVELRLGIGGGTANIQVAMLKGDIDLYPEYVATANFVVLHKPKSSPEEMYQEVKKEYKKQFNFEWSSLYGFDDSYGLAVLDKLYKQGVKTYSDLARESAKLRFGAEYDFYERPDGFTALSKVYKLHFAKKKEFDMGLKYQALLHNKVDVITVFTADGELKDPSVHVLVDDQHYFARYDVATVIRGEVLKEHPELKGVLEKMTNLITIQEMRQMNYKVAVLHKESKQVAKEFLQKKNLL